MATLRGAQGERGGTPWGWIIGLAALAIVTFGIIWWARAGAPPVDTTGQEGVEYRGGPAPDQPGGQPPVLTEPAGAPPQSPQPRP